MSRRALLIASLLALALGLVAGCGGDDDDGGEPPTGTPPGAAIPGEVTELEVSLDRDGEGPVPVESESVFCDPELPGEPSDRACELVAELPRDAGEPVPDDTACTQIYGGPDVVSLFGTLRGDAIDVELTRTDGCEIARFDPFTALLQELFEGYEPGAAIEAEGAD